MLSEAGKDTTVSNMASFDFSEICIVESVLNTHCFYIELDLTLYIYDILTFSNTVGLPFKRIVVFMLELYMNAVTTICGQK